MLLGRNQCVLHFARRCNYRCAYCTQGTKHPSERTVVEKNTETLVHFFHELGPSLTVVSGGEPLLWKDYPRILVELEQQYWVFLTNLSSVPAWLGHSNIKLILAAWHWGIVDPISFGERLESLKKLGGRVVVMIIVYPGDEYRHVKQWEEWNAMGVPTHFVPLEFGHKLGIKTGFQSRFLDDIVTKYCTSCILNGRFFWRETFPKVPCVAGTKKLFGILSTGDLHRCSHLRTPIGENGTIFSPSFNTELLPCTASRCMCANHVWADATPVSDNSTWEKYILTGVWDRPGEEEFVNFVKGMGWDLDARRASK